MSRALRVAAFLALVACCVWFWVAVITASRHGAERALHHRGYGQVQTRWAPFAVCMKNRQGFEFRAVRAGQPRTGKVCAGGLFFTPSITERRA